jgi:hypothetical protein
MKVSLSLNSISGTHVRIFHREGIPPSVILFRAVLYEWHKLLHTSAGVQSP